jgi:nicotinamide mononucleotide transporter
MTLLESLGVATGVLAIFLIARESVWGWPASILSSAIYVIVFLEARLYADTGLQVCYIVLCAYGWFAWWRGAQRADEGVRIHRASPSAVLLALTAGLAGSGLLLLLLRRTDAALPWLDAPTTAFSLVGQWMQARKWIQNWPLWIVVDLVYAVLYVLRALYLTAGLYVVFAGLAVVGWVTWQRTLARQAAAAPAS